MSGRSSNRSLTSHTQDFSVFQYIETFYNLKRINQTFGYRISDEFEEHHHAKNAV